MYLGGYLELGNIVAVLLDSLLEEGSFIFGDGLVFRLASLSRPLQRHELVGLNSAVDKVEEATLSASGGCRD